MQFPASTIINKIVCLRVMPDYEYNEDRSAERVQRSDDDGRPLFRLETLVIPAPAAGGRPFSTWLRSAMGDDPPVEGDMVEATGLTMRVFTDRENRLRCSLSADSVSKGE